MTCRTLIRIVAMALLGACLARPSAAAETLYATGAGPSGFLSGLYTVDPVTGVATLVTGIPDVSVYAGGLAYDAATDTLYATGFANTSTGISRLFIIDRVTGAATAVGAMDPGINLSFGGLAIHPLTGVLYATGDNGFQSTALFTIDKASGAATVIGQSGGSFPAPIIRLYGLGFRSDGVLFANGRADAFSGQSHLMTVNLATGAATDVGLHGVGLGRQLTYSGLAFREDGTLLSLGAITGSTGGLYSVNTLTGAATLIGASVVELGVDGGLTFIADTPVDTTGPVVDDAMDVTAEATRFDGAFVEYSAPGAIDDIDGPLDATCEPGSGFLFALGTTPVTCTATDAAGNTGSSSFDVTVVDTTAPVITSIAQSAAALWPPNHKMVPVTFVVTATDIVDPSVSCRISRIASDEPIEGLGDGDTAPDWSFTGLTAQLRAERGGRGSGRVYTVTVSCSDDAGNSSTATATVSVPKSMGR